MSNMHLSPKILCFAISTCLFTSGINQALACGPNFPLELLSNRTQTLQGMPSGLFEFEASKLLAKPAAKLTPELDLGSAWFESSAETPVTEAQQQAETSDYTPSQIAAWKRARSAPSAAEATALAGELPAAHQHYIAGAAAFRAGDLAAAKAEFEAILALGDAGASRSVWAEFMLARTALAAGEADAAALGHFENARALAAAGAADPLGLAVASLGAQAQLSWRPIANGEDVDFAQLLPRAVALYAQQAAYGSASGNASLLIVARWLNAHPEALQVGLSDALVRKLMTSYAFSRGFEALDDAQTEAFSSGSDYKNPDLMGGMDNAKIAPSLLDAILASAANDQIAGGKLDGGDRLAAALYRAGRFDDAAKFAVSSDLPLAAWVSAKLALRAGDQKTAAAQYAKVIKGFAADEQWVPGGNEYQSLGAQCRAQGEAGTLALSQGDFTEAMLQFFNAGDDYENDMSYIAERVLSTDELISFVDAHSKPQTLQKVDASEYAPMSYEIPFNAQTGVRAKGYQQHTLRAVLARRLLREGEYERALAYFNNPLHLQSAKDYVAAMQRANSAAGIKKAEALFAAASLVRTTGMEILGTQLTPDFAVYGGGFSDYEPSPEELKESPELFVKPTALISSAETKRTVLSAPKPNIRFHYRYQAVALAEQASDLLPARSQAFAATLCTATSWIIFRDQPAGEKLYRRYLNQGAYVPWGYRFGTTTGCPKPDFERAQGMLDQQATAERKKMLKRVLPFAVAGFGLLIVLGGFLLWRRRKVA